MKTTSEKKRCLLITPLSFYSYSSYLKDSLTQHGYDVTIANDEYPANSFGKILGKLKLPLLLYFTRKKFEKDFIGDQHYDIIMIIKGRGMSPSLLKKLKTVSPKIIAYTFDSFKYHSAPKKWYKYADNFYTFDYADAEKNGLDIIELFSSMADNTSEKKIAYNISAIARNHSGRLRFIDDVFKALNVQKTFVYIYEQNIFTFIPNFLKNPLLYIKYKRNIFFKPIQYKDYSRILEESDFVIDYAHPSQSGITIRCFEALNAGTKIITNNPYTLRYNYFNESNIIVYDTKKNVADLRTKFEAIKDKPIVRHNRNINNFIQNMISKSLTS